MSSKLHKRRTEKGTSKKKGALSPNKESSKKTEGQTAAPKQNEEDMNDQKENADKPVAGPQRPLASIVAKTVKLAPPSVVAAMLGQLQVHDPKTLFTVIKHLAKLTKKARIAVDF